MQIILILCGVYYTAVGLLLWITPAFFYANIGRFGTYNPHYERDLGSFLLPLGLACLFAAQAPEKHRSIVAVTAGASILHAFSHLAEGIHSSRDALELLFFFALAGALCATWLNARLSRVTSHQAVHSNVNT